jgi:hypothetical protein
MNLPCPEPRPFSPPRTARAFEAARVTLYLAAAALLIDLLIR